MQKKVESKPSNLRVRSKKNPRKAGEQNKIH